MARKLSDPRYHAKLAESLLDDPEIIAKHGFRFALTTPDERTSVPGIVIPYYTIDGKLQKDFWRYRFLEDTRKGFDRITEKKPQRYTQPLKAAPRAYLSPSISWRVIAEDPSQQVVITEGEFKAACACVHGVPTIGLGGVWNFTEKRSNARVLIPDLADFTWTGRDVVLCYDSDAVQNDQVRKAEFRVAEMLTTAGASVRVARLPSLPTGGKCGIDDYLASSTHDVDDFHDLLSVAEPFAELEALFRLNLELAVVMNPVCYYVKYTHVAQGYLPMMDVGSVRAQKDMAEALATKFIIQPAPPKKDGAPPPMQQIPLFQRWLQWEGRTTVKRMSYDPGSPCINGELINTWAGWGVTPVTDEQLGGKKLDIQPWRDLLDVVFEGIEPDQRMWFERWVAYPIQHPGTKMLTCAVLSSRNHGVGKSFISELLARIYGRSGEQLPGLLNGTGFVNAGKVDLTAITSGRNDWARGRQFVFGEDVRGTTAAESREVRDQLKDAITRTTVRVDEKYMRPIEFADRCNILLSTNDPTVFQMDAEDRRFFVVETFAEPRSIAFYQAIDTWARTHGPAHLHRYLLELPLGDFTPNTRPPMTEAKMAIHESSLTWLDLWCRDLKSAPKRTLAGEFKLPVYSLYTPEDLLALADPDGKQHLTRNALGRALRTARVECLPHQVPLPDGRQRILYAPFGAKNMPTKRADLGKLYFTERNLPIPGESPKENENGKAKPAQKKFSRGGRSA